ncbi:hypothetical protein LPJ61_003064 [Coemansia biformis]|uniref:Pentacotripeptide-repeat region of PRORP domain-containing protein n=1 Tax=Coemansia biformis TaxID=1286918 RepID=A0A9W7YDA1_9FUNG|nr:hypothetical protein LPJ61_003064 [Coemansia biformis]
MLSLAAQCRQYTTIRLPRSQGSLPVVSLTALTLWGRGMHTLLTFRPQDSVTSAVPLLKARSTSGRRGLATSSRARARESEVLRLAQSPDTIARAIGMYREMMLDLPLHSLAPWMLLVGCHDFQVVDGEQLWLARSICALHGRERQAKHDLLLCAYMKLGKERQLREAVADLCVAPALLGSGTLAAVLAELQGTPADHRLACRLWEALVELQGFRPSQTCVRLALKAAIHSDNMDLAVRTYRLVLSCRWAGVQTGYWIEKIMIYGLAINRRLDDAFELTAATTAVRPDSPAVAMQTAHKYELLLNGLSVARCADEAEVVFAHVRDDLGMRPTAAMYNSLLGVLAWSRGWDEIERYLGLMEQDGHAVPDSAWKRILLGFSKQGRVDLCDRALAAMGSRGIPYTHVVVLAAIQAFAQLGNLDMVMRWYQVIVAALSAQAQQPPARQRAVSVDGTVTSSGMQCPPAGEHAATDAASRRGLDPPPTLMQPEGFAAYFIARNELVWHRSALSTLLDVVGELGSAPLLMQLWDGICGFRHQVRTLRFSPHMYMTFARSLAWHGLLDRHEMRMLSWIHDATNGFSHSQRVEAAEFVEQCMRGDRAALCRPRMKVRAVDIAAPPEPRQTGSTRASL